MNFQAATSSEIGKRENNEDNCMVAIRHSAETNPALCWSDSSPFDLVAVVADGMGGGEYGEKASETVVEEVTKHLIEGDYPQWAKSRGLGSVAEDYPVVLRDFIHYLNERVIHLAGTLDAAKIGTTVVILLGKGHQYFFAHVGDSRLYHKPSEEPITQLTTDQNRADEGHANQVYQVLGTEPAFPQLGEGTFSDDDLFLLCTDGVKLTHGTLEGILLEHEDSLSAVVQAMTHMGVELGGDHADNATAILIHTSHAPMPAPEEAPQPLPTEDIPTSWDPETAINATPSATAKMAWFTIVLLLIAVLAGGTIGLKLLTKHSPPHQSTPPPVKSTHTATQPREPIPLKPTPAALKTAPALLSELSQQIETAETLTEINHIEPIIKAADLNTEQRSDLMTRFNNRKQQIRRADTYNANADALWQRIIEQMRLADTPASITQAIEAAEQLKKEYPAQTEKIMQYLLIRREKEHTQYLRSHKKQRTNASNLEKAHHYPEAVQAWKKILSQANEQIATLELYQHNHAPFPQSAPPKLKAIQQQALEKISSLIATQQLIEQITRQLQHASETRSRLEKNLFSLQNIPANLLQITSEATQSLQTEKEALLKISPIPDAIKTNFNTELNQLNLAQNNIEFILSWIDLYQEIVPPPFGRYQATITTITTKEGDSLPALINAQFPQAEKQQESSWHYVTQKDSLWLRLYNQLNREAITDITISHLNNKVQIPTIYPGMRIKIPPWIFRAPISEKANIPFVKHIRSELAENKRSQVLFSGTPLLDLLNK